MSTHDSPLPAEILENYIQLAKNGDQLAIEKIINHNTRLIITIINRKYKQYLRNNPLLDIDDFINAGREGIAEAIKTFDLSMGTTFGTYAYPSICWKIEKVIKSNRKKTNETSLDENRYEDSHPFINYVLLSRFENHNSNPEEKVIKNELIGALQNSLSILTPREKLVVSLRIGMDGEPKIFDDIRIILKEKYSEVTNQTVQGIWNEAIRKLELFLIKQGLISETDDYKNREKINTLNSIDKAIFLAELFKKKKISFKKFSQIYNITVTELLYLFSNILPIFNYDLYREILNSLLNFEKRTFLGAITSDFESIKEYLNQTFREYSLEKLRKSYEGLNDDEKYLLCLKNAYEKNITFADISFYLEIPVQLIGIYYRRTMSNLIQSINSQNSDFPGKHIKFKKPARKLTDLFPNNPSLNMNSIMDYLDIADQKLFKCYMNQESIQSLTAKFNIDERTLYNRLNKIISQITVLLKEYCGNNSSQINYQFEEARDEIRALINSSNSCFEQKIMLLRLGYINKHCYTATQIADITGVDESFIQEIINYNMQCIRNINSDKRPKRQLKI